MPVSVIRFVAALPTAMGAGFSERIISPEQPAVVVSDSLVSAEPDPARRRLLSTRNVPRNDPFGRASRERSRICLEITDRGIPSAFVHSRCAKPYQDITYAVSHSCPFQWMRLSPSIGFRVF